VLTWTVEGRQIEIVPAAQPPVLASRGIHSFESNVAGDVKALWMITAAGPSDRAKMTKIMIATA
jgi:hypothetical protein